MTPERTQILQDIEKALNACEVILLSNASAEQKETARNYLTQFTGYGFSYARYAQDTHTISEAISTDPR